MNGTGSDQGVISGWIREENAVSFVREVAGIVDYDFDDLDEQVIDVRVLRRTGTPLRIPLDGAIGSAVVTLVLETGMSVAEVMVEIEAGRARNVELLIDVMQRYELRHLMGP